ncbi:hypothetical protein Aperf_G00000029772 [Anoplocephala perfoliata]
MLMPSQSHSAGYLVFCALGVFCSYFLYGILQETITRTKYGESKESFTYVLSVLFIQCFVNVLFAYIALNRKPERKANLASKDYALCALSYIGAMFCSNTSLHYVDYPTQVVGKSIKPIPVMLLSVIWARKRYPLKRYLFVLMITMGVILFMYKGGGSSKRDASGGLGWGHLLLLVSLTLDGLTGGMQEDFRSRAHVGPYSLMMKLNLWSLLCLGLAIIAKNELFSFLVFVGKYPIVLVNILLFGVISAVGQMFIYKMVVNFGSLMCSIVTTTRKFFTVLASVVLFGHAISAQQTFGAVLVFSGLLADQTLGKEKHRRQGDISSVSTQVEEVESSGRPKRE